MKKNYLCNKDWYLDGKLICAAGKEYAFVPAPEEGYCDIIGCEDGNITMTSYLEAGEYFDGL